MRSVWEFLKRYWGLLLAGLAATVAALAFVVSRFRSPSGGGPIIVNDRLDDIDDAHRRQQEAEEEAERSHDEAVKDIERRYQDDRKVLSERERDEVIEILSDTKSDPAELTRRLSQLTGISEVELSSSVRYIERGRDQ
jgi:vacuolar-type H+-ATPase subunit H